MARYSAAICMRGHWASELVEMRQRDHEPLPNFCDSCGAPVILNCPNCKARLLGAYEGVMVLASHPPKSFCYNCSHPYPWADRDALIMQLRNQLEFEEGLDAADRLELSEQIVVLSAADVDDRRRTRAGQRVKQLAPKGWAVAQPILTTLLTAEIRRQLGLQG